MRIPGPMYDEIPSSGSKGVRSTRHLLVSPPVNRTPRNAYQSRGRLLTGPDRAPPLPAKAVGSVRSLGLRCADGCNPVDPERGDPHRDPARDLLPWLRPGGSSISQWQGDQLDRTSRSELWA